MCQTLTDPFGPYALPDILQPSAPCSGGCWRASEAEWGRDTAAWVARAALGLVSGSGGVVASLRAVLDSVCPEQDGEPDGTCGEPGAAGARLRARGDQASLLRRQLAGAWTACDAMAGALAVRDLEIGEMRSDAAVRLAERDGRIRELEADLRKARRELSVHENYNNPSRTATIFARMRREFRAVEDAKDMAVPAMATDGRGADPLVRVCMACGTGSVCGACGACGSCGAYAAGRGRHTCGACHTCGSTGACGICGVCDVCGMCGTGPARPHAAPDLDAGILGANAPPHSAGRRAPGHQPGVRGTSHDHRPDPDLAVEFTQESCGRCGRTDIPHAVAYKTVTDVVGNAKVGGGIDVEGRVRRAVDGAVRKGAAKLGEDGMRRLAGEIAAAVVGVVGGPVVHYTEKTTSAECGHCNVRTYPPHAHTIPGSSFGPNLRAILANLHRMTPAVRLIAYGLMSNHRAAVSTGSVSNCVTAIAEYAKFGNVREISPRPEAGQEAGPDMGPARWPAPFTEAPRGTEPEAPATGTAPMVRDGGRDAPPHHSRAGPAMPPVMDQIMDMLSMAPHIIFDESSERVDGEGWQALVARSPRAILIVIRPDRSKTTIQAEFREVLLRPAVADMYRGGNALAGPFQTCGIHVGRKSESLAVRAGDDSLEYVLWRMLRDVYLDIRAAAELITVAVGGPDRTACDIGAAFRRVPGLAEYAVQIRDDIMRRLAAIAEAYRTGDVALEDSRKMAGSICNAAPHMCTCLFHPGMPGHSNDVEGTIRQYIVRPRNIHHALPNRRAAETLGILQTLHANAALLGITSGEIISCRGGPRDLYRTGVPPPVLGGGAAAGQDSTAA